MDEEIVDKRHSRWLRASHGAALIEPFFVPVIQGLGTLDCEIIAGDQRFRSLSQNARESVQESMLLSARFTLSYLWVVGSFENLRTLHQLMKSDRKRFSDSITQRANRVKAEFVKIRSPLTKMKPSNPQSDANSSIAFPALTSDMEVAWQIGPQVFVSRLGLSNLFLEFLEELRQYGEEKLN